MDILTTILTNTYTANELRHRLIILRTYLEKKLFGNIIPGDFSPEDLNWLNSLEENFYLKFTKENLYSNFKDLENKISGLPHLTLYLAFETGPAQIEKISEWFKKNSTTRFIFDINLDPDLLGGVAIVYNGVYKDYSLRAKIQEQSQTILTEFKKYVR